MVGPGGDGGELGGGWRFVYVNICLNAIGGRNGSQNQMCTIFSQQKLERK